MFQKGYLLNELRRRWGRTLVTALGLAVGVGLVIGIIGVSQGLGQAQDSVLSPLQAIGTDILVTRVAGATQTATGAGAAAQAPGGGSGFFGPGGGGGDAGTTGTARTGPDGAGGGRGFGALQDCLPDRIKSYQASITTARRSIT